MRLFQVWIACVFLMTNQSSAATSTASAPPRLRLDDTARPLRYAARIRVDPKDTAFDGVIDIDLTLNRATDRLWIHGTELDVKRAFFTVNGATVPAKVEKGGEDFLGFVPGKELPAGPAQLHVEYQGKVSRTDDRGLFSQKEGARWYAITQFEAIFARRVFPCFDEPQFKVPWSLTLEVPAALATFSNTSVTSESKEPGGYKTVRFAETKPLPTYLVAFAVGPYELVDGGKAGKNQVPIRIAAPAGQAEHGRYAAAMSGPILERLEEYFGTPYPYEKMDNVAIPITSTFGAMENPGMVTYAQDIMLAAPSNASLRFERGYTFTATHEYAHQWFGDLVTPAFWDDIWLNESFASWMEGKILDVWKPEWTHGTTFVHARSNALSSDTLISARKIRQPIESNDDIYNAFDGITYEKGEAVLAMFENYVGAEKFRQGIQAHLKDHAHGNATADDFIAAISRTAGSDLAPAFQSFLTQAGAPVLNLALRCEADKPATLTLSQQRFLPLGSQGSTAQTWLLPVCVRWTQGGHSERSCTLLKAPQETITLGKDAGCPEWLLANDQELGYYRTIYPPELLQKLLSPEGRKLLSLPELVGVLDNLGALANAGRMPLADVLALTPALAEDLRQHVANQVVELVSGLRDRVVLPEQQKAYAHFIQKIYGEKARTLGWDSKAGEDEDTRLLRSSLVSLVANEGDDQILQAGARQLAEKWLKDRRSVSPDIVNAVISIAAHSGDHSLFQKFLAEARRAKDRRDRRRLLIALGTFRDPKTAKAALAIVNSKDFDARESIEILWKMSRQADNRELAWAFLKNNFDTLIHRLSDEQMASSPSMATGFCDEVHQKDMEKFFSVRSSKLPGGPRMLAQARETMELCRAYLAVQQPSMKAFLAQQESNQAK